MASFDETLLPLLREIAKRHLSHESPGHTLQPTALVHEAWIVLSRQEAIDPSDRTMYLAAAANTMRRLLIDHARVKKAKKRGGELQKISLHSLELVDANDDSEQVELLALEELLNELERHNPRASQVVVLRFYGGLQYTEIADHLRISLRSAKADWAFARAWMLRELSKH